MNVSKLTSLDVDHHRQRQGLSTRIMATGYPYDTIPLDPNQEQIRLLHFKVSTKTQNPDPLSCTMRQVSLKQDVPEYFAVSYAWGDASNRKEIEIDGHIVSVPENAYLALRCLCNHKRRSRIQRMFSKNTLEISLWMDAICIDQSNLNERSQQVAMMGDVYSTATEVLIWIATDNGKVKQTIATIERVVNRCGKDNKQFSTKQEDPYDEETKEFTVVQYGDAIEPRRVKRPHLTDEQELLLNNIYSARWFTRLWIVQEVLLAKKTTCYYGACSISLWKILFTAVWLQHGRYLPQKDAVRGIAAATRLYYLNLASYSGDNHLSVLSVAPDMDCSDPKDKVFALLGLLRSKERPTPGPFADIKPDYKKSLSEVYRDATRATFVETQSLELLRLIGLDGHGSDFNLNDVDFPSWVPRYDVRHYTENFPLFEPILQFDQVTISSGCKNPNILAVRGIIIDQVAITGRGFEDSGRWNL